MAVTFAQTDAARLYASSASADTGVVGYWAGYRTSTGGAFGATVSLAQSWDDIGGTYLFLSETPSDLAVFDDALSGWLEAQGPFRPRFLWIENPAAPYFAWRITAWQATGRLVSGAVAWTLHGVSAFTLGGYRLVVEAGTALTLTTQQPSAAALAGGGAVFYGPGGQFGPAGGSSIPFEGGALGAWTGTLAVPPDGLAALGVELRYAVRKTLDPMDPRLVPVSMPVLGAGADAMQLAASWDPLFPERRGRTGLRFAAGSPEIAANLVTQRGYATTLTPAAPAAPLWAGGLMFCRCATRIDTNADLRSSLYSLAPDGAFTLTVVPPRGGAGTGLSDELMLGLSGLETVALATGGSTFVLFEAGRAAFAPTAAVDATVPGDGDALLTDLATTAWLTVLPSTPSPLGLAYFAQSRQSPLFTGGGSRVMNYCEVAAARLPGWQPGTESAPATFPVGAYVGVAEPVAAAARTLEHAALAPRRRQLITGSLAGREAVDDVEVLAITPRGVSVTLPPDHSRIDRVIVANLPAAPQPQLAFTGIGNDFESALFANQSFFVVSNIAMFKAGAQCVMPFEIDLDGWQFRLNPDHWRTGDDAPTLMVWKYANGSLEALAANSAGWAWHAVAADGTGDLQPTWARLNAIIAAARRAATDDPRTPEARFYREVVVDPGWNGVLFLNAPVDPSDLPTAMRFVAAGIDPTRFYAHHVGVGITPFDPTATPIALKQSSVFGLIDYIDDVDLVAEQTLPFEFKTMRLTARFANTSLADFACKVQVSVNQLFSAPLIKQDPTHGNNLIMTGSVQKAAGAPSYAFALIGENRFHAIGSALMEIEITSVRIEIQANPAPGRVATNFALGGRLRFWQAPAFDLFSYGPIPAATVGDPPFDGYLMFSQLVLKMDFALAAPAAQTWAVNETGIGFDLPNSRPRESGLAAGFPVTVESLIASPNLSAQSQPATGLSPEDMGYLSISAPLDQVPMISPWYGLVQAIDLGTLGALAGGVGLKAELLTAWMVSPDGNDSPVYLGLKLAGTQTRGGSFPLQGVLKLGFKSFSFSTYQQDGKVAYLLKLTRFGLSALGFSFPPGNLDITLFGGPQGRSTGQLGWLAAYVHPDKSDDAGTVPKLARRRRLGRLSGR